MNQSWIRFPFFYKRTVFVPLAESVRDSRVQSDFLKCLALKEAVLLSKAFSKQNLHCVANTSIIVCIYNAVLIEQRDP